VKETSSRIAQNGCEHGDKHLVADMIPANLTMVEEAVAPEQPSR
jgi:hypothetical protein